MSGSGSAVFGLFQRGGEARAAVEKLAGSGWKVLLTESLGRVEYARRARPTGVRLAQPLARKSRID
jgi:hypothetical protein